MNSPGHRANIVGNYTDIGVALISASGTTWAVQVLAAYPGRAAPAPPAPAPPAPVPAPPAAAPAPPAPPAPSAAAPPAPAPVTPRTAREPRLRADDPPRGEASASPAPRASQFSAVPELGTTQPAPSETTATQAPGAAGMGTADASVNEARSDAPASSGTAAETEDLSLARDSDLPWFFWGIALVIAATVSGLLLPPVQRLLSRG